jgi:hypothetical protein
VGRVAVGDPIHISRVARRTRITAILILITPVGRKLECGGRGRGGWPVRILVYILVYIYTVGST